MYLHVPAAMWSMGLYLAMAVAAFVGVVWQIKMADLAIAALAPVGAVCTLVALVSGAAWGKPMWGTWWIWDARLTSELVLLFLYAGVIALWHAFDDRRLAGRAAGSSSWSGWSICPSFITRSTGGTPLHQGSTNLQQTIDPSMRLPLRICIFAFLMLSVTLTLMRLRNLILQLERRRPWVVALVNKGAAR
ncbi:cytochrome c biogenesis protein CcsA [Klebsiella variicola subsp. variicola]|nr:cytochrome c biogenesis protein CcsA [Klebsiella variicola subsp. variicola]